MSEIINNREYRQKVLKELIGQLHQGKSVDEIKPEFEKLIEGVSVKEITEMEQALIREGMPVEEIQRLCDVHAAVFKGSIEEIHRPEKPEDIPGHPVHTFKLENRRLEKLIDEKIRPLAEEFRVSGSDESRKALQEALEKLWEVDKHYLRKENLLFPYMEKYGITAPPKVMWGVDDEIRAAIKEVRSLIADAARNMEQVADKAKEAADRVIEMIFKEENILFPMVMETLTEDEWVTIAEASDEFGYALIPNPVKFAPPRSEVVEKVAEEGHKAVEGYVNFDAGLMTPAEINAMLNTLPIDITFVDKDGVVKYFNQSKERIFARPKTVIGRQVSNCHPPASVHIVEQIVEDLKAGRKDHEDFWIRMGNKFVFIRYFAVRDADGEFLGVAEVTQDIGPIQEIEGEKRLLSE